MKVTICFLLVVISSIWAQKTCYPDNFSSHCGNGNYSNVVVPGLVNVSGEQLYYYNKISDSCNYWGLGGCTTSSIPDLTSALGVDSTFLTQNYSINNNNQNVGFSFTLYQDTISYGVPLQVNITIYNGDSVTDSFVVPYSGVCTTPNYVTYDEDTPITHFLVTGNYFLLSNLSICIDESSNCGSPLLFTGDDSCSPLTNDCSFCTDLAGTVYWYTANCTGSNNTCHCQSYLYSESSCQGDVFVNPLSPSSCEYLSNFFPNANSVCFPFLQAPQNYAVNLYTGTAQETCNPVSENQCVTCSEFGNTYSFTVSCSESNDPPCVVNQYSSTNCNGTPTKSAALAADCDQLSSIYGTSPVCAFGYTNAN